MKFLNLLVITSLTVFVSCGKSGGGSKSKTGKNSDSITGGKSEIYNGKCEFNNEMDLYAKTVIQVISFENDDVKVIRTTSISDKSNCKNALLELNSIGEGKISDDGEKLFVNFDQETWKPLHKELTKGFNENNSCGLEWKTSKASSVIGTDCQEVAGAMEISYLQENGKTAITFCPQDQNEGHGCFMVELSN